MSEQRQRAVTDEVDGGLVTGDEQQDARREQLGLAELVARLFGGDQAGEQIGTRRRATAGDQLAKVVRERGA